MVRDYLEGGGQVMILLTRTDLANFNAILADYGLAMAQAISGTPPGTMPSTAASTSAPPCPPPAPSLLSSGTTT